MCARRLARFNLYQTRRYLITRAKVLFSFVAAGETHLMNNGTYSTSCLARGRPNGFHRASNCLSNRTCQPCFVGTN